MLASCVLRFSLEGYLSDSRSTSCGWQAYIAATVMSTPLALTSCLYYECAQVCRRACLWFGNLKRFETWLYSFFYGPSGRLTLRGLGTASLSSFCTLKANRSCSKVILFRKRCHNTSLSFCFFLLHLNKRVATVKYLVSPYRFAVSVFFGIGGGGGPSSMDTAATGPSLLNWFAAVV